MGLQRQSHESQSAMAAGTASSASTAAPGSCTKAAAAARRVAAEGRGGRVGEGIARAAEVSVRGEGSVAECGVRIGGGAGGGCGRRRAGLARDLGRLRGGNRR